MCMQEMIDLLLQLIYAHNFQAELKNQVHHVHNIHLLLPVLQEGTKYVIFHSSDFAIPRF